MLDAKYIYVYLYWLIDCTEIMPEHTSNHYLSFFTSKSRKDIKTLENVYFHTLEGGPFLLSE